MKKILLNLLIIFSCHVCSGESVFSHFGAQHGLVNDNVRSILEDKSGYIWVGTESGFYRFDGLNFDKIDTSAVSSKLQVRSLFVDEDNSLWVGSIKHGLLQYSSQGVEKIPMLDGSDITVEAIIKDNNKRMWLATDLGLFQQSSENTLNRTTIPSLKFLQDTAINTLETLSDETIAIAVKNQIHLYNNKNDYFRTITLEEGISVHDLHEDELGILWVATSKTLFRYDWKNHQPLSSPQMTNATRILSIDEYDDGIWIATIDGGLFKVNKRSLSTEQFLTQRNLPYSISENNITSVYITTTGMLWAGGFSSGLNGMDLNLSHFNYHGLTSDGLSCINDPHTFSIQKDKADTVWLGNNGGLVKWQQQSQTCELYNVLSNSDIDNFTVLDMDIDATGIWVGSTIGLLRHDFKSNDLSMVSDALSGFLVFFIHKNNNHLLLGTSVGVLKYNLIQKTLHEFPLPDTKFNNLSFRKYASDIYGNTYIATSQGLLYMQNDYNLQEFSALDNTFIGKNILNIASDQRGHLYISVDQMGLFHLDSNHNLIQHYYQDNKEITVYEIIPDQSNKRLWLSTNKGIVSINIENDKSSVFTNQMLNNFWELDHASHRDDDGKFYFGGIGGFVEFDPRNVENSTETFPLVFNKLLLKNIPVTQNTVTESGFKLDAPIDMVETLVFNHQDTNIGFEFIQLNYNNPKEVNYYYRLKPSSSEWLRLPGYERRLTFNNLKAGDYQLDIKSKYFTHESLNSLSFTVKAPPWLSWWAFLSYLLAALAMVFIYVRRKVASEKKINAYLNQQVEEKTKHIASQKKTVEDLMARKNEIFSNVSHEFRTPITLILGPIEELQKAEKEAVKKDSFEMISRNAKRLLNLVNQMLKLAQISETDQTQRQLVDLSSSLNMIIEPFVYLAKKNEINLTVESVDGVKLSLTEDALETIITNFLSNAIKYTSRGGEVSIGTRRIDNDVEIYVKDSGTGISQEDQQLVFKRFNRLHQNSTPGTGIGLALVKELADLNQAQLNLNSEIGQGSEFSVKFPVDTSLQNQTEIIEAVDLAAVENLDDQIMHNKQTVLIIDDNEDMRHYIKQVLSQHFNCMLAVDGLDGISTALKYVPDIIVCDVMMPDVDGFHVCRKLRGEIITCHIPLVLLTAVNEKSSRIKGWRENIDRYLNKPFDAQELVLQLKNILNTRQLLVNKAGESREPTNSYLSEIDQEFIDKLKRIIEEGYADPLFNLQKMARYMFVSDRQLQRKTKALISESPMDMVREIRLIKSAELLIKGQQISYVSDVCGFSSVSYFSRSFKNNYGMTPKAYQKLKHQ